MEEVAEEMTVGQADATEAKAKGKKKTVAEQIEEITLKNVLLTQERLEHENKMYRIRVDRELAEAQTFLAQANQTKKNNVTRQADLAAKVRSDAARAKACRHRSGGYPGSTNRGKGDPVIACHVLPFGEKILFCLRCPEFVIEPNPSLQATDPDRYTIERTKFDLLWELFEESDLTKESSGPIFMATKDGIPFRPALI